MERGMKLYRSGPMGLSGWVVTSTAALGVGCAHPTGRRVEDVSSEPRDKAATDQEAKLGSIVWCLIQHGEVKPEKANAGNGGKRSGHHRLCQGAYPRHTGTHRALTEPVPRGVQLKTPPPPPALSPAHFPAPAQTLAFEQNLDDSQEEIAQT